LKKAHITASLPGYPHQIQRLIMLNAQLSYCVDNHKDIYRFMRNKPAAGLAVSL
jgi:hypothetical protein